MRFVSKYQNEVVYTDDERKIEELKAKGFKHCELKIEKAPKVEGAVRKNVKRNKTNTKRDI